MATRLTELCTILVENAHGELAAKIFTILADHGRLHLPALHQLTRIPLRRLKNAVALLLQHHILYYHASYDEEPTYFQVNWDAAYAIIRTRKIAKLIADREGEAAGRLVSNILQLGHASVGDLLDEYGLTPDSKRDSGIDVVDHHMSEEGLVNGIAKDGKLEAVDSEVTTTSEFHSLMRKLLEKGFLVKVGQRTYTAYADLTEQVKDIVIAEYFPTGKVTGPKKAPEFKARVNEQKRKWEEEDAYSSSKDDAARGTFKKSHNKRVKLNGDLPNGLHHDCAVHDVDAEYSGPKLPNDMVVRVNVTKCLLILRSQRLERMVERFLGPATAAVYSALLRSIENEGAAKIKTERDKARGDDDDDEILPTASDARVLENLDPSVDLASTLKVPASMHKLPNGTGSHRGKSHGLSSDPNEAELGIKREHQSDGEDEPPQDKKSAVFRDHNKRLDLIAMHLQALSEHPKGFCVRYIHEKTTCVDLDALANTLVNTELDIMIHARFGKVATRVVRMLREKGKLEEKQIASMSLMRIKDVRTILTELQFHGMVDVQELPKDSSRQPSRTVYLWFFDEGPVVKRFLQQTYQGMSRTLQRVRIEREGKFRAVIEKAERTDVKGREQELLSWQEKELLREWREVEEQLLVQVARMDDVVAVLRDFSGRDTSLNT
ncbi:RNA polymerase III subunit C82 [Vermiconidia calcicola]|uniref:RNA polymerase III subunit C82 n=1 Tax=Vermiconidia calcicola TaxID=1690605 RepID=A0ACC3NNC3_9PEZI|nr:RNA polymerase III subunit C82 [Vermiconidia calcicola]